MRFELMTSCLLDRRSATELWRLLHFMEYTLSIFLKLLFLISSLSINFILIDGNVRYDQQQYLHSQYWSDSKIHEIGTHA